jgi:enoyl-CoA hydratase
MSVPGSGDAVVVTERRGAVLVVTLNRPEVRNAIDAAVTAGVAAALDELDQGPELAVAILTGAGAGFSAGMDLKAFAVSGEPVDPIRGFAGITRRGPRKPIIAAVEGFAVAGGFEVALGCDLIVAARDARFALPEVKRSLVAAGGGLVRLARRLPYHLAMEIGLTGDPIGAERLHELGLVNHLTEPGEAVDAALDLAARIAVNAPLSIAATKQIVAESGGWTAAEEWTRQEAIARPVQDSADAREGALAFVEKRPARWRGE